MKRLLYILLLASLISLVGCGVQFGYKNPVTGEADFDDDEDEDNGDDEDDNDESEDAVNSLVKNLLTSDGDEDDEDDDESDGAGSLIRSLTDIDGTHVMLGGVDLDLNKDGKSLVSDMVSNDMIVIDTRSLGTLFDENGENSEVLFFNLKGTDGYNENGYLEDYFDGDDLKDEYAGKLAYVGYSDKDNTVPTVIYINNRRWVNSIGSSALTSFVVPGGYNQLSKPDDFDDKYWLEVGQWGMRVTGDNEVPRMCALVADGEVIDLSEYVDEVDEIMEENSLSDLIDYTEYFHQELRDSGLSGSAKGGYGLFFSYEIEKARAGEGGNMSFNTKEHKNCAAMNRALYEYMAKLREGKISTLTAYTFDWGPDEFPAADLGICNYR